MFSFQHSKGHVLSNTEFKSFFRDCVQQNGIDILNNIKDVDDIINTKETYISLSLMDGCPGIFCYGDHWFAVTVSQGIGDLAKDLILVSRFENGKIFGNMDVISFPFMKTSVVTSKLHSNAARALLVKMVSFVDRPSDDILFCGKKK